MDSFLATGLFTLKNTLTVACLLFTLGAWGVLCRRNLLIMLISVEVMLNAVNLALIAFARVRVNLEAQNPTQYGGETGQIFALFVLAVAAAEAAVGLAIVITFFRNKASVDTREMREMRL